MRNVLVCLPLCLALGGFVGCDKPQKKNSAPVAGSSNAAHVEKHLAAPAARTPHTALNNPTTRGGRGSPDLEDKDRPAAWVFIDDHEGEYRSENGVALMQWFIDGPVRKTPTFRVEVFEPLLGAPRDFQCVLQTDKSEDGSRVIYTIKAAEGGFEIGRTYDLLNPGEGFTIVNPMNGEQLKSIPPLTPGRYGIAAGIRNAETGKEGLAVTYFVVGDGA